MSENHSETAEKHGSGQTTAGAGEFDQGRAERETMHAEQPEERIQDDPAIQTGVKFLRALFDERDTVLFRPIETWTESGKKRSRVSYRSVIYREAKPHLLRHALKQLIATAQAERTNIFFGVCPRFGDKGRFDLAWQIRTVRALWCDIDKTTTTEALEKAAIAELPRPSIVVSSGNGAHLYWLLDEPLVIDDADGPQPVLTEWSKAKDGTKRSRKYLQESEGNERLYLDIRANVPELSPKALHVQDTVAGIASAIGGDHTQDLSRLLRMPGTFNRKDERNGRSPVGCELVTCDESLRYPVSDFSKFVDQSPHKTHREQIAAVRLPLPKPLTPTRRDKLNTFVTACAVAPLGKRSETDWRLVCTAIEKGWPKADVWEAVANVGKFAERGEAYFEHTWTKAEGQTREQQFLQATDGRRKKGKGRPAANYASGLAHEDDAEEGGSGLVVTLAQRICERERFAQDEGGKLYRYRAGVYHTRGETFVKARVKKLCRSLDRLAEWSSHVANEVVEFIRVDSPLLWERPLGDVVNVRNGLLNLATKKLAKHSPDHLSAVQLPVVYDPAATCPKIDSFVTQVFPDDATTLAYEIPAWLMTPETSIQKAVLLIGPGGNGKSRYLRMVEAFLGKMCVSNLSLHRLESDRFACARLYGKLANICPDLPTEHLAGTSIFKAITGGDPVTGEYKFKDSFDFIPFARLVFSANSPPRALDASEGFFDRWLVVPFEQRFRGAGGEIPAQKLDAILSEPSEQSGLLIRALEVFPRLRSVGRFSDSASVAKAFSEFHATTDPLTVWLDGQTLEGPRLVTTKRALISAFNEHCDKHGRSAMSERAFGSALKRLRPEVTDAQRTVSGKVQWCYLGIGLKSAERYELQDSAELAACPAPHVVSRDSRDSRDYPYLNQSHTQESETSDGVSECAVEQDKANRVNRVNPVNGECPHEFVETSVGDRLRTSCHLCGKFMGYRPQMAQGGSP